MEHFLSVWLSDEKECVTMSHLLPVGEPKYIVLLWVKQRPAQKFNSGCLSEYII